MKLIDLITEGSNKKINCNHCDWSWKESEGGKDKYVCHKCGHDNKPGSFDEFAQTRMKGADKIATTAKAKGGAAMLTYHHFHVKNPYYKKAAEGKFDIATAKKEFKQCVKDLSSDMEQVAFQKLVGRIEVLGELIIKHKK
jgi:tRNA(Ile2) C34 agmatinyltransferase TiaS